MNMNFVLCRALVGARDGGAGAEGGDVASAVAAAAPADAARVEAAGARNGRDGRIAAMYYSRGGGRQDRNISDVRRLAADDGWSVSLLPHAIAWRRKCDGIDPLAQRSVAIFHCRTGHNSASQSKEAGLEHTGVWRLRSTWRDDLARACPSRCRLAEAIAAIRA